MGLEAIIPGLLQNCLSLLGSAPFRFQTGNSEYL